MTVRVTPADDLQAVFDSTPAGATIYLAPGVYRQKLMLSTSGLTVLEAARKRR